MSSKETSGNLERARNVIIALDHSKRYDLTVQALKESREVLSEMSKAIQASSGVLLGVGDLQQSSNPEIERRFIALMEEVAGLVSTYKIHSARFLKISEEAISELSNKKTKRKGQ